jgi:hypothetical protein
MTISDPIGPKKRSHRKRIIPLQRILSITMVLILRGFSPLSGPSECITKALDRNGKFHYNPASKMSVLSVT